MSPIQTVNSFKVTADGSDLTAELQAALTRVEVIQRLNAPSATLLTFHDTSTEGDSALDASALGLGKAIEVKAKAGEDGDLKSIFKGEVTAVDFELEAGTSYVTVRAHDKLQRLYHGSKMETHLQKKHSDVVSAMASASDLTAQVESTTTTFPYLPQAWLSNGELLSQVAAEAGFVFYARDGKLVFKKPGWTTSSGVTVTHGENLLRFRSSQTSEPAATKVTVKGWDPEKKEPIVGTASTVKANGVKLASDPAAAYNGYAGAAEVTVAGLALPDQGAATTFAKAVADRIGDAASTADGLATGDPRICPDATIKVDKVPAPVAGEYYVSEARHIYDGEYQTEFRCSGALDTSLWSSAPTSAALPLLPRQQPHPFVVLPAVVTNNKYDEARNANVPSVKVKIPTLLDDKESDWFRLVTLGAGPDRGMLFVPEVGDEVLVAFAEGDMRSGYVLGGLYNGTEKPGTDLAAPADVVASGKVQRRGLVSRTGHQVVFDDKDGAEQIRIVDKTGSQKLIWDAKEKKLMVDSNDQQLLIYGEGSGTIIESKGDLTIKSAGKLNLESQQDMSVKSSMKAAIEAATDLEIKGLNVKANANAKIEVKGNAGANLESPAITVVKGSLVQIN